MKTVAKAAVFFMKRDIIFRNSKKKGFSVMQVIKRDGAVAEYDRAKIAIAIGKANAEMSSASQRATG